MDTCKLCEEAKQKHKILPTRTDVVKTVVRLKTVPNQVNEWVNLDIFTNKAPAGVKVTATKPQWLMVFDESTEMKCSNFFETKKWDGRSCMSSVSQK